MSSLPKVLAGLVVAGLVAGSFYLYVLGRRMTVESRQHGEEAVRMRLSEAALESASGSSQSVTLYFASSDQKQLLPEKRNMPLAATDTDRMRQVLLALIEGSHMGYGRTLPPSTDIRAVFLAPDGTAYVDLSNEVLVGFTPGLGAELLATYSVVNSLAANVPAVKRVKILIQGLEVETLNGHVDLSDYFVPDLSPAAPGP